MGQEEYEFQLQKHGASKQVNALAKNIARVILSMGLEPFQGAPAFNVDDFSEASGQCFSEPNAYQPHD